MDTDAPPAWGLSFPRSDTLEFLSAS
jgi:hypothetical protein